MLLPVSYLARDDEPQEPSGEKSKRQLIWAEGSNMM